jgi:hypothetical protein
MEVTRFRMNFFAEAVGVTNVIDLPARIVAPEPVLLSV